MDMVLCIPDGIKEGCKLGSPIGKNGEGIVVGDDCPVAFQQHSCDTEKPFKQITSVFAGDAFDLLFLGECFISKSLIIPGFQGEKATFRPVLPEEKVQEKTEDWEEEEDQDPADCRCRVPPLVEDDDKNQDKLDKNNNQKDGKADGQEIYLSAVLTGKGDNIFRLPSDYSMPLLPVRGVLLS